MRFGPCISHGQNTPSGKRGNPADSGVYVFESSGSNGIYAAIARQSSGGGGSGIIYCKVTKFSGGGGKH